MIVSEITAKVSNERQTRGRFPARLIFVRNFDDYISLVNDLQTVCDVTIDLARFTKGDLFPRFKDLKRELTRNSDKQILLLSFGEYLRICIKRELKKETSSFPEIWEQKQSENLTTKYIIPIFGGREIFDQIMPIQDERQQLFIWEVSDSPVESEYGLTIYSPDFSEAVTVDATSMQEWLEKWTSFYGDKSRKNFSLTTRLYRYAESTYGGVRIKIVDEPFSYITSLVTDGQKLKKSYGSDQFWKNIAKNVKPGKPFEETARNLLNIGHNFDPIGVFARFFDLPDFVQNLLWMWYKLYPMGDYYTYAISKTKGALDIPVALRDAIFELPEANSDFMRQRSAALKVLSVSYNNDYFTKLNRIVSPETRLMMLTYKTLDERAYAIKTVSGLLRSGADMDAVIKLVKDAYPELAEYLNSDMSDTGEISQYFNWYRRSKLINRPNTDIPCMLDFDCIDSRNKVIQKNNTVGSTFFWVDGLGAEWLPLLLSKLKHLRINLTIKSAVAKSLLPSETEYNHKWSKEDEKWDRLDKLSHNGIDDDKDYFLCIARQFEIIDEIVAHVEELLLKFNSVIVTGDHGSSRLAALLFHDEKNFAIEPPKNSIVRSFGRFVELKDDTYVPLTPSMEHVQVDGIHYIVMKTYEHFKQSGNAAGGNTDGNAVAGEIHGGMMPEEYLVPVIVVTRKEPLPVKSVISKSKGISNKNMGLP